MVEQQPRPSIVRSTTTEVSPWVGLTERIIRFPGGSDEHAYHSLRQYDYVTSFAIAEDGTIPLVEQYRPAVDKFTLELPGGLHDTDGTPEETAIRELYEETGLTVSEPPVLLGNLMPDSGRLENRLWGYFIKAGPRADNWQAEPGVRTRFVTCRELRELITSGEFDYALHFALIGLAVMHGLFNWE